MEARKTNDSLDFLVERAEQSLLRDAAAEVLVHELGDVWRSMCLDAEIKCARDALRDALTKYRKLVPYDAKKFALGKCVYGVESKDAKSEISEILRCEDGEE